jgi:altronate dehydratase
MSSCYRFEEVALLPALSDNTAIVLRRLEAGDAIVLGGDTRKIPFSVLEGHRLATRNIEQGDLLQSWGTPFGRALKSMRLGDYICNARMLDAMEERRVPFELPALPNFENFRAPFNLDQEAFEPGKQVPTSNEGRTFDGFLRSGGRGAGTRNFIVVLGTTSRTASFARMLASRFAEVSKDYPNISGVVPIAHTEGGGGARPNNFDLLLRTLAGFVINPNVAAFIAIDYGSEALTNVMLRECLEAKAGGFHEMPHAFVTLKDGFEDELKSHQQKIERWLPMVNQAVRTPQPLSQLKIGLQCGGSDAFSGVSANPLLGIMSRELVRHGGAANLAETDELIGAEACVLSNVRDLETAQKFLHKIEEFQRRASWHGHSAEGNPSGGNLFRGLYNISIKAIGAARKKDPSVRLDYVIDYAAPMTDPGFYFMDSPGNDLESIAGQVASGCNLIVFATGNGSITNFPFVPTIKVMTTTARFNLLRREMDFNAGRYLDGEPLEGLGHEAFEQMVTTASGQMTAGDQAGHSQAQIWREWRQTGPSESPNKVQSFDGIPLRLKSSPKPANRTEALRLFRTHRGLARDRVGLIMPTSLCAGEVAKMIARKLNDGGEASNRSHSRYVALAHTEGCGNSAGVSEEILLRTMMNHLQHPSVSRALLLEHGCEKTHNDAMRNVLESRGGRSADFGWASVQSDGGIARVIAKAVDFFEKLDPLAETKEAAGLDQLRVGLVTLPSISSRISEIFATITQRIAEAGGTVVLPIGLNAVLDALPFDDRRRVTLDYAQSWNQCGLHLMSTPTDHPGEIITGLAATGVEVIIYFVEDAPVQSHPIVPVLQVSERQGRGWEKNMDVVFEDDAPSVESAEILWDQMLGVYSGSLSPKLFTSGNIDFQVTRGLWGVSL